MLRLVPSDLTGGASARCVSSKRHSAARCTDLMHPILLQPMQSRLLYEKSAKARMSQLLQDKIHTKRSIPKGLLVPVSSIPRTRAPESVSEPSPDLKP